MYNSAWYNSLNRPAFAPPNTIFMPVWSILYILIFISLFVYLKGGIKNKIKGIVYFSIQMILNFSWSYIFFARQNILAALITVALMWIFIFLNIIEFYKHSIISAILLVPYLIWVSFAICLNLGYYILN